MLRRCAALAVRSIGQCGGRRTGKIGAPVLSRLERPPVVVSLEFDREEMARRGRIGAYARLARHDPRELTQPARDAFLSKFEREVDPDGTLAPEERQRRAECARKAHMLRLARLSAAARARKAADSDEPATAA